MTADKETSLKTIMQHALRSSVTALQRREVQSPSRSLQKDDLGKGVLTEMSASYTLMLLTQEEWGRGCDKRAQLNCLAVILPLR